MAYTHITDAERTELVAAYEREGTLAGAAKVTGRSVTAVKSALKKAKKAKRTYTRKAKPNFIDLSPVTSAPDRVTLIVCSPSQVGAVIASLT